MAAQCASPTLTFTAHKRSMFSFWWLTKTHVSVRLFQSSSAGSHTHCLWWDTATDQAHTPVRFISSWGAQVYIFWALSSTYSCIWGNTGKWQVMTSVPELNLSMILVSPFWSFNRHRGMFLLTLTMSDVMVFSGISLGSCMWTSCSSATIHGKSWEKGTDVIKHKYKYHSLQETQSSSWADLKPKNKS